MIGAAPLPAPEPFSPRSAPHSCAHQAAPVRCSSPAAAEPAPHARARSQAPQYKPQIAPRFRDPSLASSPSLNLVNYLILDSYSPRPSDSVRLVLLRHKMMCRVT